MISGEPLFGVVAPLALVAYVRLLLGLYVSTRSRGRSRRDAAVAARFGLLSKFPIALGWLRAWVAARAPHGFSCSDGLAILDTDFTEVAVHRDETLAMVDEDGIAVEVVVAG